jgi:hypothetical protein
VSDSLFVGLTPLELTSFCRYVSELLYIHTKLMIVDDRRVIVRLVWFSSRVETLTMFFERWGPQISMIAVRRCV